MPLHQPNEQVQPRFNQLKPPIQPQYQPNRSNEQGNYQPDDYTLPRFPQDQYQPNQPQYRQPNQYQQQPFQQPQYQPNQFQQFTVPPNSQGVWRRGNEVVIHKHAQFPAKCVKCGQDFSYSNNGRFARQKFRWHNPLVYIALISPLIYLIIALIVSERFSYDLPFCQTHFQERETTKNYLIGGGFAAVGLIVLLGMLGSGLAVLVGLAAIFVLPIVHEYVYKPFRVKCVDRDYVYLQGASQDYLNTLPY
jgi:hypothetical protein